MLWKGSVNDEFRVADNKKRRTVYDEDYGAACDYKYTKVADNKERSEWQALNILITNNIGQIVLDIEIRKQ